MIDTTDILQRLSQPLDIRRVRHRQVPGEGSVPYLEGFDVIQTANQIFGYRWSFDLLSEPRIMLWEQVLNTWDRQRRQRLPVVDPQTGQPKTQRAGMVYLTGKVTIELDGKAYTHADVGRLSFTGDTPEALDTALSGAATDCLKRCLRQLGDQFGLSLYDKEANRADGSQAGGETRNGRNGNGSRAERKSEPKTQEPPAPLTIEQAGAVLCPVGSRDNPHWAGMPLRQVLAQADGRRMLDYLAGEGFKANADPRRQAVKDAARVLLGLAQKAL